MDDFTREYRGIKVARRMPARVVMEVLKGLVHSHGIPKYMLGYNGPGFIARAVRGWLQQLAVQTHYIDQRSPCQNAYGESSNSKFRDDPDVIGTGGVSQPGRSGGVNRPGESLLQLGAPPQYLGIPDAVGVCRPMEWPPSCHAAPAPPGFMALGTTG